MLSGKQHNLDRKFFLFSEMELIHNLLQQGTQSWYEICSFVRCENNWWEFETEESGMMGFVKVEM